LDFEDIDLNLFKIFYAVYQCGSFSKAAENIGVTQPNISYSIKKLEDNLGIKLFERSGYSALLTSEAEVLIPYVEQSLKNIKNGINSVNDFIDLNKGQISVGVPSHIGVFLLAEIIKKFNMIFPNIRIKVISKSTKELFRLLNNNDLEVVIDSSPLEENIYKFNIQKISTERCAFACNKKLNSLLNHTVQLSEIMNYSLIVPSKTSSSTKALMKTFEKYNFKFEPHFEITTSDMIAQMLEENIGIGYLFEKTINAYPNLQKINLDIQLPVFDIYIISKEKNVSIPAQEFISFIKNKC